MVGDSWRIAGKFVGNMASEAHGGIHFRNLECQGTQDALAGIHLRNFKSHGTHDALAGVRFQKSESQGTQEGAKDNLSSLPQ